MNVPDRRQASPPQGSHELINIEENAAGVNSPVYGGALLEKSLNVRKDGGITLGILRAPLNPSGSP